MENEKNASTLDLTWHPCKFWVVSKMRTTHRDTTGESKIGGEKGQVPIKAVPFSYRTGETIIPDFANKTTITARSPMPLWSLTNYNIQWLPDMILALTGHQHCKQFNSFFSFIHLKRSAQLMSQMPMLKNDKDRVAFLLLWRDLLFHERSLRSHTESSAQYLIHWFLIFNAASNSLDSYHFSH